MSRPPLTRHISVAPERDSPGSRPCSITSTAWFPSANARIRVAPRQVDRGDDVKAPDFVCHSPLLHSGHGGRLLLEPVSIS